MKILKTLCVILLVYTVSAGILFDVPRLPILNETIRVLYFHVPMWFTMIFLLFLSSINAYRFISSGDLSYDLKSYNYANIGIFFGVLGIISGMIWAKYTWGTYWTNDPKLNGSAVGLLIYFSYFVLRNSVEDESKKGKILSLIHI